MKVITSIIATFAMLSGASAEITLRVVSSPEGARVTVDGHESGTAPTTVYDLTPGPHAIVLSLDGYLSAKREVDLEPGARETLLVTLERAPNPGTLAIRSTPPGASVFIDGQPHGSTPMETDPLEVGEHVLVLKLAGHADHTQTVSVGTGAKSTVTATLAPRTGSVRVHSAVEGAEVHLDGKSAGRIRGGQLELPGVIIGAHAVRVVAPAGEFRANVQVEEGAVAVVDVVLASGQATLTAQATPRDVMVRVASGEPQQAPVTATVPAGVVRVDAQLGDEDYGEKVVKQTRLVSCPSGGTCTVQFDLSEPPERKPGDVLFRRDLEAAFASPPAVLEDQIYILTWGKPGEPRQGSLVLHNMRPGGTLRWSQQVGAGPGEVVLLRDASPFVAFERGGVGLFSSMGAERWRYGYKPTFRPAPTPDGGAVIAERTGRQDTIVKLTGRGRVAWSASARGLVGGLAVDEGGRVVAALASGEVLVLSPGGVVLGRHPAKVEGKDDACESQPAVLGNARYYVAPCNGLLQLVEPGGTLWTVELGSEASGVAVGPGGEAYVGGDGRLSAVSPLGKLIWTIPNPGWHAAPVIGADGVVYTVRGKLLTAVSREGESLWETELPEPGARGLSLGWNGALYLGVDGGRLMGVQTTSFGTAESPWPTAR